jgi:hypothetical protein
MLSANGSLGNAILEVRIHATKGELLLPVMAGLLEGIVLELPIVAVIVMDPDAGDCFAIAWQVLLQNESNNKIMAACSSSRLHFRNLNSNKNGQTV